MKKTPPPKTLTEYIKRLEQTPRRWRLDAWGVPWLAPARNSGRDRRFYEVVSVAGLSEADCDVLGAVIQHMLSDSPHYRLRRRFLRACGLR